MGAQHSLKGMPLRQGQRVTRAASRGQCADVAVGIPGDCDPGIELCWLREADPFPHGASSHGHHICVASRDPRLCLRLGKLGHHSAFAIDEHEDGVINAEPASVEHAAGPYARDSDETLGNLIQKALAAFASQLAI